MATETSIANDALSRMGFGQVLQGDVNGTLASCTDTSHQKAVITRWYATCRDRLLEEHPWTFARKSALLVLADNLDDDADIWGNEWDNAFTYPADCIRARRFVGDSSMGFCHPGCTEAVWPWGSSPWKFVVRVHAGAKVILTDVSEDDANLEYTERVTSVARFPIGFQSALTWYIAHEASIPLSVSAERSTRAYNMFRSERWSAKAYDVNEENPYPDERDGAFLSARRGR